VSALLFIDFNYSIINLFMHLIPLETSLAHRPPPSLPEAAFLEERGVTPALGGYLLRLAHDKEEREYSAWLRRARAALGA
jgi:hypothetical protein